MQQPHRRIRQIGALPFRTCPNGDRDLFLVTTRGGGRWIIPKGNPISGLAPHEVAAREAFEEAGLVGAADRISIGCFEFSRRREGRVETCVVDVFPLQVQQRLQTWAEAQERSVLRCNVEIAASLIRLPSLSALIRDYFAGDAIRRVAPA